MVATRLAAVAAAAFGDGAALLAAGEGLELMRIGQATTLDYLAKACVEAAVLTRLQARLAAQRGAVVARQDKMHGGGDPSVKLKFCIKMKFETDE